MSESAGEKTEQATPRKLEEAYKKGQFPRSQEIQTVFVLMAGFVALKFTGLDTWNHFLRTQYGILSHLHEIPLDLDNLQSYAIRSALMVAACAGPVLVAAAMGGLLAGGIQNRFQTSPEALGTHWEKLNPVSGFQRIFSARAFAPAGLSLLKLGLILGLCYSKIKEVLQDPLFFSVVDPAKIAGFLAKSSFQIGLRIGFALLVIATLDYAYQFWRTRNDLMMTKQEVKEEMKNQEGDPQMKARQRRRRSAKTFRQMMAEVPQADVIVTNPTHLAVALKYDRKSMKAPRIVAKGSRLNALKIREIATQHQIPIVENKPLARMMFKHGRVGGEIPAQLYAAVAEVLAYVYRVNRYRYFAEQNQV